MNTLRTIGSCSALVFGLLAFSQGSALADASGLDPTFGTNGLVIENFGLTETGGAALQLSTGKLLLMGNGNGMTSVHSFARYNLDGTIDPTYGTGGKASGFGGALEGVTLLPGDALLVAGDFDTSSFTDFNDAAVSRYTATGAKDTTFGTGGRVTFRLDPNVSADEHATDVIPLASGKLLVCGWIGRGGANLDVVVMRLESNGAIDTTFGNNGYFNFDFMGGLDKPHKLVELPDKSILVYGEAQNTVSLGTPSKVLFLRLTEQGQIDTTFGGSGTGFNTILTDVNSDGPGTMTRLADGKVLFAITGTAQWTAGRILENGTLDPDFGTAGIAKIVPIFPDRIYPTATSIALARQSNGKIVIGGWMAAVNPQFQLKYEAGLARFTADGQPDTTFNSGSAQRLYTVVDPGLEVPRGLLVQKDGKLLLSGAIPNGNADDRFMLRVAGDAPQSACGDANGDGKINASDALLTLRAAVGTAECPVSVCDATGDGKVRTGDALRVLQYAVGGAVTLACPA